MPKDTAKKYDVIQWLMIQVANVGPAFGNFTHFNLFAPKPNDYAFSRYKSEMLRLYELLETRLGPAKYLGGDEYSIADIATFPWIRNLIGFYGAGELVGIDDFANVKRVLAAFLERPAVVRGLGIPARPTPPA